MLGKKFLCETYFLACLYFIKRFQYLNLGIEIAYINMNYIKLIIGGVYGNKSKEIGVLWW